MSNLLPSQGTKYLKKEEIQKNWILIDCREQVLGRLAGRIVHRLRGKHRPDYAPHINMGDHVICINARHIRVTGNKMEQKLYYRHSNYPGGMKTFTLKERMEKDPTYALEKAVKRMLPSGALGRQLLRQVHIYPDSEHPHGAQKPEVWEPVFK